MLEHIEISNFKSIKNIKLDLGRVNIFIGENGSGKSNILEAIVFWGSLVQNKLNNEYFTSRGIRISDATSLLSKFNKKVNYKIGFHVTTNSSEIEGLKCSFVSNVHKSGDLSKSELYEYKISGSNKLYSNIIINDVESSKLTSRLNQEIKDSYFQFSKFILESNFLIFTPENTYLRTFSDEGQILPLGIKGEGLFKEIKRIFEKTNKSQIKQILKELQILDWFESFEIPQHSFPGEKAFKIKDRYLEETTKYFDQRLANEGFLYLLFYFTLLISEKTPSFFAIDNIDASLNPKLCSELIKRMSKISKTKKKQFIATTHNPFILDGLNLDDDSQRLFVVSRNINGETIVNRVQPKQKLTIPLSEAWMRGYLGGLPNNF